MKSVKDIRSFLNKGEKVCNETPGWYRWWCKKEVASQILRPLKPDMSKLLHENIDG